MGTRHPAVMNRENEQALEVLGDPEQREVFRYLVANLSALDTVIAQETELDSARVIGIIDHFKALGMVRIDNVPQANHQAHVVTLTDKAIRVARRLRNFL